MKPMFWGAIFVLSLQALWNGIILTSIAIFLNSLTEIFSTSSYGFSGALPLESVSRMFDAIPKEEKPVYGFIMTLLAMLLGQFIKMMVFLYITKFSTLLVIHLRGRLYSELQRNSMTYFDNCQKGSLLQVSVSEVQTCSASFLSFHQFLIELFNLLIFAGFLLVLSWEFSLVVGLFAILLFQENNWLTKKLKRISDYGLQMREKQMVSIEEGLGSVKLVKLLNYYVHSQTSMKYYCHESEFTHRKADVYVMWQATLTIFLGIILVFFITALSLKFSLLSISSLLLFLYTLKQLLNSFRNVNQRYNGFAQYLPSINRVVSFFEEAVHHEETSGNIVSDILLKDKIVYKNIGLKYGEKKNILCDINLTIHHGQTIAFVGESGAGKTSLVNLLPRLYIPSVGQISIDGTSIEKYDLGFLRSRIGVVSQEPIFFSTSVRENLLMARPDASDAQIRQAAMDAYAHEFIEAFPDQYNTMVGDRGVKLSGGQRQRLQIAQVFLKDSEILIFDEATSALDSKSEEMVHQALQRLAQKRTTLIIAHRLSTVQNADKIVVLQNGSIVEYGSWSDLLEKEGVFKKMVQKQAFSI